MIQKPAKYLINAVYTAFLFTRSDIKTVLLPITISAAATAPVTDLQYLVHAIIWVWIHLLQADVANQTMGTEEDTLNKSYRPIPSGRITHRNAVILRWILVPVCFTLSAGYSLQTFYASAALVGLTVVYNERGAHAGNFVVRNVVNACGVVVFEIGAILITGADRGRLNQTATLAVCISGGILATTIQAPDFEDEMGDRKIGRRTIPIVFPSFAKYTVAFPVILWSFGLSYIWELDVGLAVVLCALGLFVGVSFVKARTIKEKHVAYWWYKVWLSAVHALPGYYYIYRMKA